MFRVISDIIKGIKHVYTNVLTKNIIETKNVQGKIFKTGIS